MTGRVKWIIGIAAASAAVVGVFLTRRMRVRRRKVTTEETEAGA